METFFKELQLYNEARDMEPQLDLSDLGIAFSKLAEALCIELNVPCKRRYTHAELADSFRAIRQVNAERDEHLMKGEK